MAPLWSLGATLQFTVNMSGTSLARSGDADARGERWKDRLNTETMHPSGSVSTWFCVNSVSNVCNISFQDQADLNMEFHVKP